MDSCSGSLCGVEPRGNNTEKHIDSGSSCLFMCFSVYI